MKTARRVFRPPSRSIWVAVHLSQDMDGPIVTKATDMQVAQAFIKYVLRHGLRPELVDGDHWRAMRPDIIRRVEVFSTRR